MERDKYKVKILHHISPHLIWALVEDDEDFHFEQIGIYGVLPLDISIDLDGSVTTKRADNWLPATYLAMLDILRNAAEVWFTVSFMDRTTSIFDDNSHKYGDLKIKMKDGQKVSMLEKLLDTGFVTEDVLHFHQNLRTKLDYVTTATVINNIRKSFQSCEVSTKKLERKFNSQISIHLETMELEVHSTLRNMEVHNREKHSEMLYTKQTNDLNACKDVDEVSAGRANTVKSTHLRSSSRFEKLHLKATHSERSVVTKEDTIIEKSCNENTEPYENSEAPTETPIIMVPRKGKKLKPKGDDKDKKLIAFGPPGLRPTDYKFKEVEIEKDGINEKKLEPEKNETEDFDDKDIFSKADSDVDVKISNLDILKSKTAAINKSVLLNKLNALSISSKENSVVDDITQAPSVTTISSGSRKMRLLRDKIAIMNNNSSSTETDSAVRQGDDSDCESISAIVAKLDLSYSIKKAVKTEPEIIVNNVQNNVNPFKNLDGSKSVFVDRLVTPTLMVHTKKGNRIQPVSNIRDIPFGTNINVVLRNMNIKKPMRLQTVSWPTILRGHSVFMVSPYDSGKTMGYLPAVCRLVSDSKQTGNTISHNPLTCIILCATSYTVSQVEERSKMLLHHAKIFACYTDMTDLDITTAILNGCDILICTPTLLVRLMRENLGLDLRSLNTLVIDDCERMAEVYQNELKFSLLKVKEMLKSRANKEHKVQYVVASRIWCNFMSSLAKKAPDSVVCIAAFQECVLYSEADTSVEFLSKENKMAAVLNFLADIDKSKKTVIACRTDEEVHLVEKALSSQKYVVFACDSTMDVHDLYKIDLALNDYKEPLKGPILVCCDSNLTHINVTDSHYLIHFSLPELFSMFCKRFSVLIDNYASIFDKQDTGVKIKIFLENSNIEQLPKILHFLKRCSDNIPATLDDVSAVVMSQKDLKKAQSYVPLCNTLLTLGECADIWNCKERHTILKDFDEPKPWMPKEGAIAFKILHFMSPVHYSARLISHVSKTDSKKYPQIHDTLSVKLGMYYSNEKFRKLHGSAKPGDVCAVALKLNLFARCQVMRILKYNQVNHPSLLLIKLIDEEKYEMARDTSLYHLPDEFKTFNMHVATVILANLKPLDRDITYSVLAEDQIKRIIEKNEDGYMRGQISLVLGNCIFIDTLEVCHDLASFNDTVVKNNIRNELLDGHAVPNPDHLTALKKLSAHLDIVHNNDVQNIEVPKPIKVLPTARWAHLESEGHAPVYYLYAKTPSLIFLQHVKFQDCISSLVKDIKKYVSENPGPIGDVNKGDIILAKFPDDACFERARIDDVINDSKVKCFFVDLGDWRIVTIDNLVPITEKLITQLPFQAIECKLVGIKPLGDKWSEFATNWLVDQCYDSASNLKYLYAKRFTKEKALFTEGGKYGIVLIDTYNEDVYINNLMIDANLAEANDEVDFLETINLDKVEKLQSDSSDIEDVSKNNDVFLNKTKDSESLDTSSDETKKSVSKKKLALFSQQMTSTDSETSSVDNNCNNRALSNLLFKQPIRSVGLVESDDIDDDRWDSFNAMAFLAGGNESNAKITELDNEPKIVHPAIAYNTDTSSKHVDNVAIYSKPESAIHQGQDKNITVENNIDSDSESDLESTHVWSVVERNKMIILYDEVSTNEFNTMQIVWYEVENNVIIKIQLTTDEYVLKIEEKELKFHAKVNNNDSGFKFELHDTVYVKESTHENKGRYIEVNLAKKLNKHWKSLYVGDFKVITKDEVINLHKIKIDNENNVTDAKKDKIDTIPTPIAKQIISTTQEIKDELRKPKIVWRQTTSKVTMKVLLSTEKYDIYLKEKHVKFYSVANDEKYGFELELYGVIDVSKSSHVNKGQYVQVNLKKIMAKNWLMLTRDLVKRWIVYDVDNIDVSSEESDSSVDLENLKNNLNINDESDSEDDFHDDANFEYKRQFY